MKNFNKNIKGIAITEMIVIMSIVIILAVLAYPKYYGVQEEADRTNALNAAETMAKALKMYQLDYKYYPSTASVNILMPYTNITSLKVAFDTTKTEPDTSQPGVGIYTGTSSEVCIEGIVKYLSPEYKIAYCVEYGTDTKTQSSQPTCYWNGRHGWQPCVNGM